MSIARSIFSWDLEPMYVDRHTFLDMVQDGDVWHMETSLPKAVSYGINHKLIYFWKIVHKDPEKIEYFGFATADSSFERLPLGEKEFSEWLEKRLRGMLPGEQNRTVPLLLTIIYSMTHFRKIRRLNLRGLHT